MKPRTILLVGWLGFLFFCYPGFMKVDAADMLVDSRVGIFTNVHSPMLEQVWRLAGIVISGPVGMLVLQSVLLLLGAYSLLRRVATDKTAAILAVVVLVFPPLMITTALISPEASLASFTVAGAALLPNEQRWKRLAGLGLLVVACGMRAGGVLAVIPIIVAGFRWKDTSRLVRGATAIGAAAAVVLLALGIEWAIVDVDNDRQELTLAMNDIVGSIAASPKLDDAKIRDALSGVRLATDSNLQARAKAIAGQRRTYSDLEQGLFAGLDSPGQRDALVAARRAVIRTTPSGYARYRWGYFLQVIGLGSRFSAYYTDFIARPEHAEILSHTARHALLQSYAIQILKPVGKTFLFRPYLYLLIALVLLPFAIVRRDRLAITLLASGLLYEIAMALDASRVEYRDSHWLHVATVLALMQLILTRAAHPQK